MGESNSKFDHDGVASTDAFSSNNVHRDDMDEDEVFLEKMRAEGLIHGHEDSPEADKGPPEEVLKRLVLNQTLRDPHGSRTRQCELLGRIVLAMRRVGGKRAGKIVMNESGVEFLKVLIKFHESRDVNLQWNSALVLFLLLCEGHEEISTKVFVAWGLKSPFTGDQTVLSKIDQYLIESLRYPYIIVPLLLSPNHLVVRYTCACLALLLSRNGCLFMFMGEIMLDTMLEALVSNISSTNQETQMAAVSCLVSLSSDMGLHEVIVRSNGLEHLIGVIQRPGTPFGLASAAALGLRLLVQRNPFLCYKSLETKLGNGERILGILLGRVRDFFLAYYPNNNGDTLNEDAPDVSTGAVIDIMILLTTCTRNHTLFALMMDSNETEITVLDLAILCFEKLSQEMKKEPSLLRFKIVLSQLLLHLAMLENCLPNIMNRGGYGAIAYVLNPITSEDRSTGQYIDLHSSSEEKAQRKSRHLMYSSRVLTKLAMMFAQISDHTSVHVNLDAVVGEIILPIIAQRLEEAMKLEEAKSSNHRGSRKKFHALTCLQVEAALKALGWLLLREQWTVRVGRFSKPIIQWTLNVANAACKDCRFFAQGGTGVAEEQLSMGGHACIIFHLSGRVLSNLAMYPHLLSDFPNSKEILLAMWKFFTSCKKEDIFFSVPMGFLLETNPDIPIPREHPFHDMIGKSGALDGNEDDRSDDEIDDDGDIEEYDDFGLMGESGSENVAIDAAIVECQLGKGLIQISFYHRLFPKPEDPKTDYSLLWTAKWIRYAETVYKYHHQDPHIAPKSFSLIGNAMTEHGWTNVWAQVNEQINMEKPMHHDDDIDGEDKEDEHVDEGSNNHRPLKVRTRNWGNRNTVMGLPEPWPWVRSIIDMSHYKLKKGTTSVTTCEKNFPVLREIMRILLFLTWPCGFERDFKIILHVKFQNRELLNEESVSAAFDADYTKLVQTSVQGNPLHITDCIDKQQQENSMLSMVRRSSPWGVVFPNKGDGIVVRQATLSASDGWTISFWIRHEESFGKRKAADPSESGLLQCIVGASNGDQLVSLLETPIGLELGCIQQESKASKSKDKPITFWLNSKKNNNNESKKTERVWYGSGVAIDRLEPGWHHIAVRCDGNAMSWIVDTIHVGEKTPFLSTTTGTTTISMIGNSVFCESPLDPAWILADVRAYNLAIPLATLCGTPARVSLNRRPWEVGNVWDLAHEYARTKVGPIFAKYLVKALKCDIVELQLFAAKVILNLVSRRQNIPYFVLSGAIRIFTEKAHVSFNVQDPLNISFDTKLQRPETYLEWKRKLVSKTFHHILVKMH